VVKEKLERLLHRVNRCLATETRWKDRQHSSPTVIVDDIDTETTATEAVDEDQGRKATAQKQ